MKHRRPSRTWEKVSAFANLGRFVVALARFVRELLDGEGPGPSL